MTSRRRTSLRLLRISDNADTPARSPAAATRFPPPLGRLRLPGMSLLNRGDIAADCWGNAQLIASVADSWGSREETQCPTGTHDRDAVRHDDGTPVRAAVNEALDMSRGFTTPGRVLNTPSRCSARLCARAPPLSLLSGRGHRKRRGDNDRRRRRRIIFGPEASRPGNGGQAAQPILQLPLTTGTN